MFCCLNDLNELRKPPHRSSAKGRQSPSSDGRWPPGGWPPRGLGAPRECPPSTTKPLQAHQAPGGSHVHPSGPGGQERECKVDMRPRGKKQALRSTPRTTLFSLRFENAISERRASVGSSHPNWGFGKLAGSHRNLSHFT